MILSEDFIDAAYDLGFGFYTGVPCSFLTPFINDTIQSDRIDYVGAASEGEAIGIALGAHLAGRKTVVMCQNSGLGNTVNPLTSLNYPFRIPTLLITTHRGGPGLKDEPQHELMGQITGDLLNLMKIPWDYFPDKKSLIATALEKAETVMRETKLPYGLVMRKGSVSPCPLAKRPEAPKRPFSTPEGRFSVSAENRIPRIEAIRILRETAGPQTAMIATTGKTGRELFTLGHAPNQFYVVGGMGCASSIGLGIHLSRTSRKVVIIDGDGAVLMKMGVLGTIGNYGSGGLIHVVLDNEAHESTGSQSTVMGNVDLASVASACHYGRVFRTDTAEGLKNALQESMSLDVSLFIHMKIKTGSLPDLGRPTLSPIQVKEQFMEFMGQNP